MGGEKSQSKLNWIYLEEETDKQCTKKAVVIKKAFKD